jgi:hypothetical protein
MCRRDLIASLIILAGLTAVGTFFAQQAYPMWDDSWLQLVADEKGPDQISDFVLDRPVAGEIWEWLAAEPDRLVLKAVLLHWATCFGMALATLYFAAQIFPGSSLLSLATACLAATTAVCRTQIVLAVQPVAPGITAVATFLAIGLIAGTISTRLPPWKTAMRWLMAITVFILGGIVTEYFVAASLAGVVWLLTLGLRENDAGRLRSYKAALGLLILSVITYFIYHQLASAEARIGVRPESFLAHGLGWRARVTIPVWLSSVYVGCAGAMLDRIASLRLLSFTDVAGVVAGMTLAIAIHVPFWRYRGTRAESANGLFDTHLLVGTILAVAAGLLPLIVMGRRPSLTTFESRFWTPVIPFALCASVGLLATLLRHRRLWILPVVCALVAGWSAVSDGLHAVAERRTVMNWGDGLRKHLSNDGLTVAVFDNGWRSELEQPRDYELTARLASHWPAQDRQRFWAFASSEQAFTLPSLSGVDPAGRMRFAKIDRQMRGVARVGPVQRVIWIFVAADGKLRIATVDADHADPRPERAPAGAGATK